MLIFQWKHLVEALILSFFELELVRIPGRGIVRIVTTVYAGCGCYLTDQSHGHEFCLLIVLVLEAHILILHIGSARPMTHLTAHADEISFTFEHEVMADLGFRFTWYGHATVHVESEAGTSILVDPWFGHPLAPVGVEAIERCDVMLVTHGHHDHLGSMPGDVANADALTIARRTEPAWPAIHSMTWPPAR